MGVTKTAHFTAQQNELAALAKALGHPARVAIIAHLLQTNRCICSDLVNELPLAQPTISQHLKELRSAGLIKGNIEGTSVCYCIDESTWYRFRAILEALFEQYTRCKNNCC